MNRVMERVLVTDPFIKEKHHSTKPLYAALVPDEIFKDFESKLISDVTHPSTPQAEKRHSSWQRYRF